ncbi:MULTISPECIES: arginine N-succinyltransferase [Idiomarina]|jgi:arginine N-succinyltransferase|uniref:arginine N-succinyltransferase n=1 Tax=Idiomarina TaxID=135575 RepID=UPI0007961E50|nr:MULTISPECIES: arginine N-succinyltransferase [Idiomarina]KXS35109.1 MAG: arginine N-succinyltransferase [Idiomarina sp. T82-3]MAD53375.1 arginine N-succinyltransferase [Idiomarinaceae bacterium]NQZ05415.1 arginine N-succinyltransferase [Idiomarina sp.]|tara:strand:+ start:13793 stop:14818 length:1026 start_codon:yes stop_codon:yes gene_type:complete
MLVIRPIEAADYEALYSCAVESGHGFTSLPIDQGLLERRIARAQAAFAKQDVATPGDESYLFVMEDTETGEIAGVSGIEAAVGLTEAFWHYRLGKVVHHSEKLNIHNTLETLSLCNDYTGVSELCTLFLREPYRHNLNGRTLSRFRMLFLAQFKQRFSDWVIAEMRGVCDDDGASPFWDWLEQHFFSMDFPKADYLSGIGDKTFIAELMPRYPIYTSLLPEKAREVIGKVHDNTRPALKLLESEGFRFRGFVDIFDAGPTVEAEVQNLRSVRNSVLKEVVLVDTPVDAESATPHIICNTQIESFRAAQVRHVDGSEKVQLSAEQADKLNLSEGDTVRIVAL